MPSASVRWFVAIEESPACPKKPRVTSAGQPNPNAVAAAEYRAQTRLYLSICGAMFECEQIDDYSWITPHTPRTWGGAEHTTEPDRGALWRRALCRGSASGAARASARTPRWRRTMEKISFKARPLPGCTAAPGAGLGVLCSLYDCSFASRDRLHAQCSGGLSCSRFGLAF